MKNKMHSESSSNQKEPSQNTARQELLLHSLRRIKQRAGSIDEVDRQVLVRKASEAYWQAFEKAIEEQAGGASSQNLHVDVTGYIAKMRAFAARDTTREFILEVFAVLLPIATVILFMHAKMSDSTRGTLLHWIYIPLILLILGWVIYSIWHSDLNLSLWKIRLRQCSGALVAGCMVATYLSVQYLEQSREAKVAKLNYAFDRMQRFVADSMEQRSEEGGFIDPGKKNNNEPLPIVINEPVIQITAKLLSSEKAVYEVKSIDWEGEQIELSGKIIAEITPTSGEVKMLSANSEKDRDFLSTNRSAQFAVCNAREISSDRLKVELISRDAKSKELQLYFKTDSYFRLSDKPNLDKPTVVLAGYTRSLTSPNTGLLTMLREVTPSNR